MVRVPYDVFRRRSDGHVRAVVQLDAREVLEVDRCARGFLYAHGVLETQAFAQRMVVQICVVFGYALRVPLAVRPDRQHALVSENRRNRVVSVEWRLFVSRHVKRAVIDCIFRGPRLPASLAKLFLESLI